MDAVDKLDGADAMGSIGHDGKLDRARGHVERRAAAGFGDKLDGVCASGRVYGKEGSLHSGTVGSATLGICDARHRAPERTGNAT